MKSEFKLQGANSGDVLLISGDSSETYHDKWVTLQINGQTIQVKCYDLYLAAKTIGSSK